MNTTTATATSRRSPVRRVLAAVVVAAAALTTTLGLAAPAQAAGYVHMGSFSINSYYGAASGTATLDYNTQTSLAAGGMLRDVRTDGYCTVLHVRGVYGNNTATAWRKAGSTCSTAAPGQYVQANLTAAYGRYFTGAQIRVCQADRYGNAIGTCSGAVWVNNWQVRYV